MDSARQVDSKKLLNLQQAAEKLGLPVDALIDLSENNILVPTVGKNGLISYPEEQIERYLHPEAFIEEVKPEIEVKKVEQPIEEPLQEQARRAESEVAIIVSAPVAEKEPIPSGPTSESVFDKLVRWAGNGFYQDAFAREYAKASTEPNLNLNFSFKLPPINFRPTLKQAAFPLAVFLVLVVLGIFTQQNRIAFFLDKSQNQTPSFAAQANQAVLGAQTSKMKLTGDILLALPLIAKENASLNQNLEVGGTSLFKGNITAPNVLYGVKAGDHIIITNAASQTPTISADLSGTVSSLQGQTGDVTLVAGSDISISGTTINDISTLATVVGRGGCDSCITDADVSNSLTIDATGQIAGEAIKTGVISPTVGGTGLTSYNPGDMLYASTTNTLTTLSASDTGQFLMMGMNSAPEWQYVGSFAVAVVKEDNAVISPVTNVLNFSSGDFSPVVSPVGQVNFTLAPTLTSVTGVANNFNVGGSTLSFTNAGTITSSGANSITLDSETTGSVNIGTGDNAKTINIGTGSGGDLINIATNGTNPNTITLGAATDTTTISGNTALSTAAGATTAIGNTTGTLQINSTGLQVATNGAITIPGSQTLTVGTIGLNASGSSNLTSGANLVGVYAQFNNSGSNDLQQVLKDFDTAITSAGITPFYFTNDITYGQIVAPTVPADNFILGGASVADSKLFFNATTANLAVGTDNTGSGGQNGILTLYSAGNAATDTYLTTNNNGDLLIPTNNVGIGTTPTDLDADNHPFKLEVAGSIGPSQNGVYDLGSPTMQYRNLYLTGQTTSGGNITIANPSPTITFVDTSSGEDQYLVNVNNSQFTIKNNSTGQNDLVINGDGTIALSSLNAAGVVVNNGWGLLSTESQLDVTRGGTGINGSTAPNGFLLIGNGAGYTLGPLTGTLNQINIASTAGAITFSLPQDIAITSTPAFAGLGLTNTANQLVLGNTTGANHTLTISSPTQTANVTASIPSLTNPGGDVFVFTEQAQTLDNKTIGSTGLVFSGATADINTQSGKDLTVSTTGLNTQIVLSSVVKLGNIASAPSYPDTATTLCRDDTSGQISQCPANAANVDLQQAYNAGNTITTNNNNNIGFTLASGETTSFTLSNEGTAPAFIISDNNAGLGTALQIQSGVTPTLTVLENGTLSTIGNLITTGTGSITSASTLTAQATSNQLVLGTGSATTTFNSAATTAQTVNIPELLTSNSDTFAFLNEAQTLDNKTIGSTGLVFSGATADINTQSGKDLTVSTTGLNTQIVLSSVVKLGNIASAPSYPDTATTLCRDDTSGQISQCPANAANVDLQQAYNAGNTITTNNNKSIDFTLGSFQATSFTLTNKGINTSAFVISDTDATHNALEVESGITPTLTIGINGDLTTPGNISTTNGGTITSNGLLTASTGLTETGALSVTGTSVNITGTSGALSLSGLGASSIALTGTNNLLITANNFNTTATGINNTAIGTDLQSSGAFTTLNASGTVTFSNLPFNGPVYATAGGILTSEQYLSTTRGGTGLDTSLAQNGELLIGNGAGLSLGYIGGTLNQINVASTSGTITLSLPQDIALTSSPTFAGMNLTSASNQLMLGGSGAVTTISSTSSANQTITIPTLLTSNIDSFAFLNEAQILNNKTIGSTGLVSRGRTLVPTSPPFLIKT